VVIHLPYDHLLHAHVLFNDFSTHYFYASDMPAIPSLQTGPPLPSSFKRKELEQLALRRIHAEFQFLPTLTEEHLLPPGNVRGCEEGAGREYMKYYVESFIDFKRYSEQEIGVIEEVGVCSLLHLPGHHLRIGFCSGFQDAHLV